MAGRPSWHHFLLLLSIIYFVRAQRLSGVSAGPTPSDAAAFATWRGRNVDYAVLYHPGDSWNSIIFGCTTIVGAWASSIVPNRAVVSIPMLPADGSIFTGYFAHFTGSTYSSGATGAYNTYWTQIGQCYLRANWSTVNFRIGWSMNTVGLPWSVRGKEAAFVTYWREIVNSVRSAGPNIFRFIFSPDVGGEDTAVNAATLWPGSSYADEIGPNVNDIVPAGTTDRFGYLTSGPTYSLNYWSNVLTRVVYHSLVSQLATTLSRTMSIPCWRLYNSGSDPGAIGDDPTFIDSLNAYIQARPRIAWEAYDNLNAGTVMHSISGPTFTQAQARYIFLFGGAHPVTSLLSLTAAAVTIGPSTVATTTVTTATTATVPPTLTRAATVTTGATTPPPATVAATGVTTATTGATTPPPTVTRAATVTTGTPLPSTTPPPATVTRAATGVNTAGTTPPPATVTRAATGVTTGTPPPAVAATTGSTLGAVTATVGNATATVTRATTATRATATGTVTRATVATTGNTTRTSTGASTSGNSTGVIIVAATGITRKPSGEPTNPPATTGRPADVVYYVIVRTIVCIDASALYDSLAQFLELARDRLKQVAYGGCGKRQDPELKFYVEGDLDGAIAYRIADLLNSTAGGGNDTIGGSSGNFTADPNIIDAAVVSGPPPSSGGKKKGISMPIIIVIVVVCVAIVVALCLVVGIILWRGMKEEDIEKKDEGKQYVRQVDNDPKITSPIPMIYDRNDDLIPQALYHHNKITNPLNSPYKKPLLQDDLRPESDSYA